MSARNVVGLTAIVFGVLTVFSGGRALFGGADARAAVGDAIPFVLWFNFIAGFFYIAAGVGIVRARSWAGRASVAIAAATLAVFVLFGIVVAMGTPFETRTLGAMILRSAFWLVAAVIACRSLGCFRPAVPAA